MAKGKNGGGTDWTPFIWAGFAWMVFKDFFPGEKDTPGDKQDDKATTTIETTDLKKNPFEPSYVPTPKKLPEGTRRITLKGYSKWSSLLKQIKDSIGYVWDDEGSLMSALRVARTKPDIWVIATMYDRQYKENLYTVLKQNLKKKEINKINGFVSKLPDYVSA